MTISRQYRGVISIHALRVEGDPKQCTSPSFRRSISIHALRVEGDALKIRLPSGSWHFYPRPPGGGRPFILSMC